MSYTLEELRARSTKDLIADHDAQAKHAGPSVNYFLDELARRDTIALTEAIARNTDAVATEVARLFQLSEASGKRAERLTLVVTVLTALNLVIAAVVAASAIL